MFDTKIIVVRHAQGEGNLKGEFHGQYPSDLTELGITQAQCTADFLASYHIDVAFSSDTPRAYSTAKIIAEKHGIDVVKNENFREICGGKWERMRFDDIMTEYRVCRVERRPRQLHLSRWRECSSPAKENKCGD